LADTIRPLLNHLERQERALKNATLTSKSISPRELVRDKEVNNYSYQHKGGFASFSTQRLIDEVLAKYPITKKGTRHGVLVKLIGELSHKFGLQLSERIVEKHYELSRDNVTTGRDDHMREFRNAWKSFRKEKIKQMTDSERTKFDKLKTEPQREAFLLCRSFAELNEEFPVPQVSLADRIGVTQQAAGGVIEKLISIRAIEKTAYAKTNRKSAYYKWSPYPPPPGLRRPPAWRNQWCPVLGW
jgi:hypothetical protein